MINRDDQIRRAYVFPLSTVCLCLKNITEDLTWTGSWAFSFFTLLPQHHSHRQGPLQNDLEKKKSCDIKKSFSGQWLKHQSVPEHTHMCQTYWKTLFFTLVWMWVEGRGRPDEKLEDNHRNISAPLRPYTLHTRHRCSEAWDKHTETSSQYI